jgi:hypothetical protein
MEIFQHDGTASGGVVARFNAWTDRHRTALTRFLHATSFAVLFGFTAHAGYRAPLAEVAQTSCGSICLSMPGFDVIAAAVWGFAAIAVAMAYARLLQALRPYEQRKWRLELFGWCILAIAISHVDALVGAHALGGKELYLGLFIGGFGPNPPRGVLDFFWSKFARE